MRARDSPQIDACVVSADAGDPAVSGVLLAMHEEVRAVAQRAGHVPCSRRRPAPTRPAVAGWHRRTRPSRNSARSWRKGMTFRVSPVRRGCRTRSRSAAKSLHRTTDAECSCRVPSPAEAAQQSARAVPVCPELRWASRPMTTPMPPRISAAATAITVGSTHARPRARESSSRVTVAVGSVSGRRTVGRRSRPHSLPRRLPASSRWAPTRQRRWAGLQGALRRAAEPARSSVPVVGVLGHAAGDDVVEGDRKARIGLARSRGRRGDVGRDQILKTVTRERDFSRQRLVQHTCQRVDIDRWCADLSSKPFGRHVIQGADLHSRQSSAGCRRWPRRFRSRPGTRNRPG